MSNEYLAQMFDLQGKTAVVVGAGRGLGQRMAVTLGRAGATVVLCARSADQLAHTAGLLTEVNATAVIAPLDVSDVASVERILNDMGHLDIVVNAAAIVNRGTALELENHLWEETIATNLTGAFAVARTAAKSMLRTGTQGRIIHIASVQAFIALRNRVAYASSKAGTVQMVKSLAYELGPHGITVNAILPGFFKTDINHDMFDDERWFGEFKKHVPGGLPGDAKELDTTLLYLASPSSRYTTGTTISVDGGLTAGMPL